MEQVLEIQQLQNVDRQRLREVPLRPNTNCKKVKSIFDKELVKKLSKNAITTYKTRGLAQTPLFLAQNDNFSPIFPRFWSNPTTSGAFTPDFPLN